MSLKLGELGYNVVINYRSPSSKAKSEEVAKEIEEKYGVKTLIVKADVSKYEECENLVDETVKAFGYHIDCLVNNAGITNNCNWIDIKASYCHKLNELYAYVIILLIKNKKLLPNRLLRPFMYLLGVGILKQN